MNAITPSTNTYIKYLSIIKELIGIEKIEIIFEFGSRYGEDTIEFAKSFPNAKIFAFECNPNTFDQCLINVKNYKNIELNKYALSNFNGFVKFYPIDPINTRTTWFDGNQGASSLLKATGKYPIENYVQNEVNVECLRIDYFLKIKNLNKIDVMWIDVQGAELMVLEGIGFDLQNVNIIHIEVEFFEIYNNQPLFEDIKKYLINKDFIFLGYTNISEYSGDAIFLNRKIKTSKFKINSVKRKHLINNSRSIISKIRKFVGI
jgi:FkbM family methyltransferase